MFGKAGQRSFSRGESHMGGLLFARDLTLAILGCAAFFLAPGSNAVAKKPNIIILLTDDQGYGDLSCLGNPVLKTPYMDRLHAESVRLTDFHVAPMCSPTRGQLLTGMDALRNGATSVTAGRCYLRPGIPTLPEILRAAGYRTGLFGKWHLGDNYPHRPMDRGFEESNYVLGWGFTSAPEFSNTLFDGRCWRNGIESRFTGYCTDYWFNEAMKWMKERKEKNELFFLYLPTTAPHFPHIVADKYSDPYKGKGPAKFFGMIANIDENMGRLEEFLKQTGLRDNTILIFMGDNGGTDGIRLYNAGMRGGKTQLYDGGHRVHCFIRWSAGKIRGPRDISTPTQAQDILPTLLDLCNIPKPAKARFDGVSLAGLLQGTQTKLPDRMLVVQYGQDLRKGNACVIWNKWRLVRDRELYDIVADPGQRKDVAANHPDVVKAMREHYGRWWEEVSPKINDMVTTSIGSEKQNPVQLSSTDWEWPGTWADNAYWVREAVGGPRGGAWNVLVERDGVYEIALRRWPAELDLPLNAREAGGGKALPIAAARLQVAGLDLAAQTAPTDKAAVFRVHLPKGKTKLHGWFKDADGRDLCGAYYARVTRLADK